MKRRMSHADAIRSCFTPAARDPAGAAEAAARRALHRRFVTQRALDRTRVEAGERLDAEDPRLPAAVEDLTAQPLEIFERLVGVGQKVGGALQRHRAEPLEPPPHHRAQVERLRRQVVQEEEPLAHVESI
jgi:hypothetical protein